MQFVMKAEEILLGELKGEMKATYGRVIVEQERWEEAIALARSKDDRLAFRASWGLGWAYNESPEGVLPYLERFIGAFVDSTSGSVHREYSKILYGLASRGVKLSETQREKVVARAFDLLINPAVRPAAKVWCMEIVWIFRDSEDWIAEALQETLRELVSAPGCPRGLENRAGKVLKRFRER